MSVGLAEREFFKIGLAHHFLLFFFALTQKRTKKGQDKKMLPRTGPAHARFFVGPTLSAAGIGWEPLAPSYEMSYRANRPWW